MGAIGLIVIGIVIYGFYIGERLNTLDEPMIDAVMEIQLEAEAADLWFREVIRGNMTADLKTIWQPLEQAVWYLHVIARDSKIHRELFNPLRDNETRDQIKRIQLRLAALEKVAGLIPAATRLSGSAGNLREQYEKAMADFLEQVGRLENRVLNTKAKNLRHFRYLHLVLVATCIALFLAIALSFQFFVRRRGRDYQALREVKQRLEKENSERLRAQTGLKAAHQELEERVAQRTRELSRANENLTREIAERKQIELQLHKSKSMLQGMFDGIPDSLILVDHQMRLKMINKSASTYYKVNEFKKIAGKTCFEITGDSDACKGCRIPAAVRNGRQLRFDRKGFIHADRTEQVMVFPLETENGEPGDAVIRVTDITATRMFERQLIKSEKMASLGILVSSVAHEINNPNSFISFNIPILKDYIEALLTVVDRHMADYPDLEFCQMPYEAFRIDIFRLIENIGNGADRISAFVSNLREFSQSDGERLKRYVDLKSVVDKVVAICGKNIKHSIKTFEIDIPSEMPQVYTAPHAMEQILINLLMNAAQAADKENSYVKLVASIGDTWLEHLIIDVIDNGRGIDEISRDRLFDPFYTTKLPGQGTGLGLYVCHNLIQGMGGRIEVQSEPGAGSKFTVILPDKNKRKNPR